MSPQEYRLATTSPDARQAEARVGNVLRGGYVVGDAFYTCTGSGYVVALLSSVGDLRYAPYTSEDR